MGQGPSQPKITAQDRAIFQLKRQRDNLKQYQRKLAVIIEKQQGLAKQALVEGKKDKAKFYLRSRKQQESTINKTYEQLGNLENLIGTIEFKLIEKDVVYGLSQGNEVLKKLNSEMSVEKIDKVIDDLEDERLKVDEVSDMLGMGSLSHSEENEVDEEMAALERELAPKEAEKPQEEPKEDISLPDAPTKVPEREEPEEVPQEEQEEEEQRTAVPA
ncbi:hypothetical protein FT663_04214 [Candidozyma haemuli var. vulneris]|uniref:Charged multivesicular body protein 6 n=1 Tax=Candidozyma haemuli TaxID=45357 RepID=A0A2V1ASL7_9ASCO|nr:hypothetical protein CXQ85_004326 [[Candida] haemuloni]KAF3987987.1 hypothetical protein FT663_04214 [[Candida] haemuloni var. vulneris]KAF3991788.1 hypothetical protein FT662_01542 [[Candida] haemuloni var. vulneris]PVH20818.1 hypothetical protein CXQ85_004326 [[Candida] haemuloni]